MSEPEKDGAAAFIAGVEEAAANFKERKEAYVAGRVARLEALMRVMMAEAAANPMHREMIAEAAERNGVTDYDKEDPNVGTFEDAQVLAANALANIYGMGRHPVNIEIWGRHLGTVFYQRSLILNGHMEVEE